MKKVLKAIGILIGVLLIVVALLALYVKTALPNTGPAMDLKVEITPARVAHGAYLAQSVYGCMICHSSRDNNLYGGPAKADSIGSGGELFGRREGFPGMIYAPNLTPYKLAQWTDGELFKAITTGQSRDGRALFPIMNYPAFRESDPEDIFSIIAYLRTLTAVKHDVPARTLDFPMSIIVNTIPGKAALTPRPDSNNAIAYGKYLVKMASCVECHSKAEKGQVVKGTEFGGGRDFGPIHSANITPDSATGIGSWTRELFIRKFKQYTDSGYTPKVMAPGEINTPMPWMAYRGMREKDLAAIYAYLRTVKSISNKVPALLAGAK